jgi:hypothetical protein
MAFGKRSGFSPETNNRDRGAAIEVMDTEFSVNLFVRTIVIFKDAFVKPLRPPLEKSGLHRDRVPTVERARYGEIAA